MSSVWNLFHQINLRAFEQLNPALDLLFAHHCCWHPFQSLVLYIEYTSLFSTRESIQPTTGCQRPIIRIYKDLNPHLNPYMAFNSLSAKCIYNIHAFSHNHILICRIHVISVGLLQRIALNTMLYIYIHAIQ